MNSITIDCDTQAGQTIDVATGTTITITGTYMMLPEWFNGNVGIVPSYGTWMIELLDGIIIISNPEPLYIMTYDHAGGVGTLRTCVTKSLCPIVIRLPYSTREGYTLGGWEIDGVVYSGTYELNSDIHGVAIWEAE